MRPEIETVRLPGGVELEYVESGDASGVPLLLLHGGFDSWRAFERVLPLLPPSIRAISVSQRGHGNSSRPEAGYLPRDFARDAVECIDALGIGEVVVVAHSSTTLAAQRLAIDHPDRTFGLVMIGAFSSMRENPIAREVREVAATLRDPIDREFVAGFQHGMLSAPVPESFMESIVEESVKIPVRVWRAVSAGVMEEDAADELDRISAPTLLLWGERDEAAPRAEQERIRDAIPDCRLVTFPGTGHVPHWEEPERVAAELVRFVTSLTTLASPG